MIRKRRLDLGEKMAAQLRQVQSTYETADETYRRFRTLILEDPPDERDTPVEWIPVSDN